MLVNFADLQNNTDATAEAFNSRYGAILDAINGSIDATNLADNAVTTPKITNGAVTEAKLGTASVTPTKISNPYKFRAYLNQAQNLTQNTWSIVTLNAEDFDTNNNFNTTTYRYVAPVEGIYHFDWHAYSASGTELLSALYKNGAEISRGGWERSGASFIISTGSETIQLAANDYIQMAVINTASSGSLVTGTGNTSLSGFFISA